MQRKISGNRETGYVIPEFKFGTKAIRELRSELHHYFIWDAMKQRLQWIRDIDNLATLGAEVIIPGHQNGTSFRRILFPIYEGLPGRNQ
jgi:hypothetical protein